MGLPRLHSHPRPGRGRALAGVCLLLAAAGTGCRRDQPPAPTVPTVTVERQDVVVTATADGVIEPILTVEVKSKASGEIVTLTADTGDGVAQHQVLAQLLPRDARNAYEQAEADLDAARAERDNAQARLTRTRSLHTQGIQADVDLEAAELTLTAARTRVIRAQKSLDTAAERLAETTVRSPITGTVLSKAVEVGQVVSSAVTQVSGGTLLFTLADLRQVQVRSLVDEVDIGQIAVGLPVTVRAEAYPERRFAGTLFKIEPQAVVEENVTLFPVLTRIDNADAALKPGMNVEVEVLIAERRDVVAVPNQAIRTRKDALQTARMLGLSLAGPEGAPPDGRPGASPPLSAAEGKPAGAGPGGRPGRARKDRPGNGARRQARPDRKVVLKAGPQGCVLVPVVTGLHNWDVTEVREGLAPGEEILLPPGLTQLRRSAEYRERLQRTRGIPGVTQRRGGRSKGQSPSR